MLANDGYIEPDIFLKSKKTYGKTTDVLDHFLIDLK